jgi:hypothetical protein
MNCDGCLKDHEARLEAMKTRALTAEAELKTFKQRIDGISIDNLKGVLAMYLFHDEETMQFNSEARITVSLIDKLAVAICKKYNKE